ncbi:serine/threonine-protein kinase [Streptomyces sp. So13.3]|uniref:serine/threonine-protein kinase n=1 Tax=Streptomyces sp. So13.3 TaxID=2136173 RepID=UPI001FD56E1F|nr:serine/threonine-protein kinase [Streptomyces sp. So13.3]
MKGSQSKQRFGPFMVLGELASGGMGRVYLAVSAGGRMVAVKTLLADEVGGVVGQADRRRFAREVLLAQRVQGVYTASVVAADAQAPMPWMATEYIAAPSLRDLVAGCGTLRPQALYWVAAGIAEALVSIHAAGLVHRDVKPSNVLLPIDGPRVIDFGISHAIDMTRTQAVLGTVAFAAPEQAQGQATTPASDVFSLGATLFHLAVGRAPYRDGGAGPAMEQLVRAATGDLDVSGLSPELHALILPCLALVPAHRPTPAQILQDCAGQLRWQPAGRDGRHWLDPAWTSEIQRYGERRSREVEDARQRVDPNAVTGPVEAPQRTTVLPPPPPHQDAPPGRGKRGRAWAIGSGAAVVVVVATLLLTRPWQGGGPTLVAPDEPVGFFAVETKTDGVCSTDPQAQPVRAPGTELAQSYTADDRSACATVTTPGALQVRQLDGVRTFEDAQGGRDWVVEVTLNSQDAARFSDLTGQVAGQPQPRNEIAITQGKRMLANPAIMQRLTGRTIQIATHLTTAQAQILAEALGAR